jgi:hypothetical protein
MEVDAEVKHKRFSWSSRVAGGIRKLSTNHAGSSLYSRRTYLFPLS